MIPKEKKRLAGNQPVTPTQEIKKKISIWPEWNDADINAEKWDAHGMPKVKEDKKGKSPTVQQSTYFEDPDGKLDLPVSLRVDHWKRPIDFMGEDKTPVVVDVDHMNDNFDLLTNNKHLHHSDFLRYFISQVTALWNLCIDKVQTTTTTTTINRTPKHSTVSVLPADNPPPSQPQPPPGASVIVPPAEVDPLANLNAHHWRPWEHIYSLNKVMKNHVPLYNPYGKYIVKLYWMGCWRKILVDDLMPFDRLDQLLLPVTMLSYELWPMLLAKALLKVASLDYGGGNPGQEFGDVLIVHNLTGWLPEAIPLHTPPCYSAGQVLDKYYSLLTTRNVIMCSRDNGQRHSHLQETWELLKALLPEWQLPEVTEPPKAEDITQDLSMSPPGLNLDTAAVSAREGKEPSPGKESLRTEISNKEKSHHGKDKHEKHEPIEQARSNSTFKEKGGKDKGERGGKESREDKKGKKDKDSDKDKDKKERMVVVVEEPPAIPEKPEVVVFAMFGGLGKKVSQLALMADASERLRQNGLSHLYPHPVCITQTRSCSMELPPTPEVVPAWKLIRPRKKKERPTDEPRVEEEPPKDIQCLEMTSAFINYNVNHVPIPTNTYRTISFLERGLLRNRKTNSIEEIDEQLSEREVVPEEFTATTTTTTQPPSETDIAQQCSDREEVPPEETEEAKGTRKNKVKSAKRDKSAEHELSTGKGQKGERVSIMKNDPKSKGLKRTESKVSRVRDEAEDKKDHNKDKVDKEPESLLLHPEGMEEGNAEDKSQQNQGEEGASSTSASKPNTRWIDFDQFCVCFRTLYIFHKPATYLYNQRCSDLKHVTPATPVVEKKGDKKQPAASPGIPIHEDKSSYFLFVDSVAPSEIIISYSVLPRWFEVHQGPTEEKRPSTKQGKERDSDNSLNSVQDTLPVASPREPPPPPPAVTPGSLVAEPYSWKSLVTGQPILRLRTTGIRAAVLSLPPGRHVLKFLMTSPLAHHVHMCSTTAFVLGDEETIMPHLVQESARFKDNAVQVMNGIGRCLGAFSDGTLLPDVSSQLQTLHWPPAARKENSTRQHILHLHESLYSMLRKALKDVGTHEMALAWRAFTFDLLTPNILGLPLGPRPDSSSETPVANTGRGSGKPGGKKHNIENKPSSEPEKTESVWMSRYLEPTVEEQVAAVKIQKVWRGYRVRKVKKAATPGTVENVKAQEQLLKSWSFVEPSIEENGLFLFRELFRKNPSVLHHYPFYNDEWNRVAYTDYKGVYPEQNPHTWFIVFREILYVREETLAVPRIYIAIPTCMLRVIDNDTGHQLPTVFQKVAPYVYKPNKKGYTFVMEARTLGQFLASGSWRMRLIGSFSPLPAPRLPELTSTFHTKEIQDYYLPNNKDILLRYSVKMAEDQLVSIQVSTSKVDVYLRLTVMDHEEELASATGKGHVVIPAFIFHKDVLPPASTEDTTAAVGPLGSSLGEPRQGKVERKLQAGDQEGTKPGGGKGREGAVAEGKVPRANSSKGLRRKPSSSVRSQEDKASRDSHTPSEDCNVGRPVELKLHKYIVQATVLKNSWPLSPEDLAFINRQKDTEKNELKVFYIEERQMSGTNDLADFSKGGQGVLDRPISPNRLEKTGVPKLSKKKTPKDKQPDLSMNMTPASPSIVLDRPHWTLRMVVDATAAEDIEVKKDRERADEIRAMKKAWEDAEPGRAAKAHQSRQQFLKSHTAHPDPEPEENKELRDTPSSPAPLPDTQQQQPPQQAPSLSPSELASAPSPGPGPQAATAPSGKQLLPMDFTPYLRGSGDHDQWVLVDEEEEQRRTEERQRDIAHFKEQRKQVEAWRARDKAQRNIIKIHQLDEAQRLQVEVDKKREAVNVPREAFRQVYLEAERKRQEEIAQQEALLQAELEASKADKKNKKSPKGKKGKK